MLTEENCHVSRSPISPTCYTVARATKAATYGRSLICSPHNPGERGGARICSSSSMRRANVTMVTRPLVSKSKPRMSRKDLEALGSQRESLSTNPLLMQVS